MPGFVEVRHAQWIEAPLAVVQSPLADIAQRGYPRCAASVAMAA
jgi:hypothetical protein